MGAHTTKRHMVMLLMMMMMPTTMTTTTMSPIVFKTKEPASLTHVECHDLSNQMITKEV